MNKELINKNKSISKIINKVDVKFIKNVYTCKENETQRHIDNYKKNIETVSNKISLKAERSLDRNVDFALESRNYKTLTDHMDEILESVEANDLLTTLKLSKELILNEEELVLKDYNRNTSQNLGFLKSLS